jgi:hypothetical protein
VILKGNRKLRCWIFNPSKIIRGIRDLPVTEIHSRKEAQACEFFATKISARFAGNASWKLKVSKLVAQ